MRHVELTGTDLQCSAICLGTSQMGTDIPEEKAFAMLDLFLEAGGNFLDTASCYADWTSHDGDCASERTLGRWLESRGCRGRVVLGTKGGHPRFHPSTGPRLSSKELRNDLESSLEKLGTDDIDIYWLHRDDPSIHVEDIMGTLSEMVGKGLVRYLGCSNWRAERIRQALDVCGKQGWPAFIGDQMMWNMAVVDTDAIGDPTIQAMDPDLYELHLETGMAAIPFSGQANGLFTKMASGTSDTLSGFHKKVYGSERNAKRFGKLMEICGERGITPTQGVLGFLTGQPFPTLPIVGCRTEEQLRDSLTAGDMTLTQGEIELITAE